MKILIAEDNPLAVPRLQGTIEAMGHEVVVASHGAEAWDLLRRDDIQLVISDWSMSGIDGLELGLGDTHQGRQIVCRRMPLDGTQDLRDGQKKHVVRLVDEAGRLKLCPDRAK